MRISDLMRMLELSDFSSYKIQVQVNENTYDCKCIHKPGIKDQDVIIFVANC